MSRTIGSKLSLLSTCLACTVSLALAADWLVGEWLGLGSPAERGTLLVVSFGCMLFVSALTGRRQRAEAGEALAELNLLCRMDQRRLATESPEGPFGEMRPGTPWSKTMRRLRNRLILLARRVGELERERSVLEARGRRETAHMQRIQSILSALAEPVLVIDKRDELVLANSSANALFAIDGADHEHRAINTLVKCERLVELLVGTRKCKASTQRSCEIELPGSDNQARWFRVTARNIPTAPGQSDPDGTSQGVVAILHDISGQKTIQKRNAEFVSAVSHEMNTPLAGIKAYLELLADGDADDEQTEEQFLQVISTETDRLQCLVDDLVELARIEADLAGATRQDQLLSGLLADAVSSIAERAEAKGVTLHTEYYEPDLHVLADRHMITQAAAHLLCNAVNYTPSGGRVTLRTWPAEGEVCFEVTDTGVGLSQENLQKVFEKFYRVRTGQQTNEGIGLGLALVKHIVEAVHGGRIEVQSALGEGSTFRVLLPAATDACRMQPRPAVRAIDEGDL